MCIVPRPPSAMVATHEREAGLRPRAAGARASYAPGMGTPFVVLNGAKRLPAAMRAVFGDDVAAQQCQRHKRDNLVSYLPIGEQSRPRRKSQRPTRTRAKPPRSAQSSS